MKKAQISIFYSAVVMLSIFLYLTVRWMKYKTPQVEISVLQYSVDKTDPLLIKSNIAVVDDKYYYGLDSTFVTIYAGTFPLLEKKTVTRTSRWSRPIWAELND